MASPAQPPPQLNPPVSPDAQAYLIQQLMAQAQAAGQQAPPPDGAAPASAPAAPATPSASFTLRGKGAPTPDLTAPPSGPTDGSAASPQPAPPAGPSYTTWPKSGFLHELYAAPTMDQTAAGNLYLQPPLPGEQMRRTYLSGMTPAPAPGSPETTQDNLTRDQILQQLHPAHETPVSYHAPPLWQRLLFGLSAAAAGWRHPEVGANLVDRYNANNQEHADEAAAYNRQIPQANQAADDKAVQQYLEGQGTHAQIGNINSEISGRLAAAAEQHQARIDAENRWTAVPELGVEINPQGDTRPIPGAGKLGDPKMFTVPGQSAPVVGYMTRAGVVDGSGQPLVGAIPYEKPAPVTPRTATIMIGGKPMIVPLVPGPDGVERADTAHPIGEAPPNYAQEIAGIKTYTALGSDGIAHIYTMDGKDLGVSGTGAYAHEMSQAAAVQRGGEQLISDIQANRDQLGTLGAWVRKYGLNTPIADPNLAGLQSELASFAALQPAMHGFRSHSAMESFANIIGDLQKNPDATIQSIQGILKTAGYINPLLKAGSPGANSASGEQSAPAVGKIAITTPAGVFHFKDQAAADAFKQAAGIQ